MSWSLGTQRLTGAEKCLWLVFVIDARALTDAFCVRKADQTCCDTFPTAWEVPERLYLAQGTIMLIPSKVCWWEDFGIFAFSPWAPKLRF